MMMVASISLVQGIMMVTSIPLVPDQRLMLGMLCTPYKVNGWNALHAIPNHFLGPVWRAKHLLYNARQNFTRHVFRHMPPGYKAMQ